MRVYLAAPFSQRAHMECVADYLKAQGIEVTARWVYGGEEGLNLQQIAILDLEDVDAADTVVSFIQPRGTYTTGGGRHVEFGYALAKGKKLVTIGAEWENIFHHHPSVKNYPSIREWLSNEPDWA